ncbi:beta strand repeat-containing protein [Veillonella intestinalis]|uniref:beta strand repeat-containing protein n=1 Tax=Veillonella intestinalis TaxID=2941341 RepID=UPI00203B7822|nr:YadA-like family protein [Veillonella intestinalis]
MNGVSKKLLLLSLSVTMISGNVWGATNTEGVGNGVAIGESSETNSAGDVAIGKGAVAKGTDGKTPNLSSAIAIGLNATVQGTGTAANADNPLNGIAIGRNAKVIKANAIAMGDGAEALNQNNVSVGLQAGVGTTGYYNFAFGSEVGQYLGGEENISLGRWANTHTAQTKNTDSHNIAIGLNALRESKSWTGSPIISSVYSKGGNVALGSGALEGSEGASNVALGVRAGRNINGAGNIILGTVAGANAGIDANTNNKGTALTNSIVMGTQAGNNAGGDKSVIIGHFQNNAVVASNVVAIGSNSRITKQFGLGLGHGITNDAKYGLVVGSYNKLESTAEKSGVFGIGTYGVTSVSGRESYAIGNSNQISTNSTFVLGNNIKNTLDNSVFLGSKSAYVVSGSTTKGIDVYTSDTINGQNLSFAGGDNIAGVVSVGSTNTGEGEGTRRIQNVAAGLVSKDSTDAINGSQLYAVANSINESINNITDSNTYTTGGSYNSATKSIDFIQNDTSKNYSVDVSGIVNGISDAVNTGLNFKGDVGSITNVKMGESLSIVGGASELATANNIGVVSSDKQLQLRLAKDIDLGKDGSITIGETVINNSGLKIENGPTINDNGIDMGGTSITNIKPGDISKGSTDAVTGDQLYETNQKVTNLSGNYNHLNRKIDKVGAGAAALAGLHPLGFNADDKWSFAVGYGNYKNSDAVALGAYYQPNEDTLLGVASSMGNGENMFNASLSFKVGQSSGVSRSRVAMAQEIIDLKLDNQNLRDKVNELDAKVNQLLGIISNTPALAASNEGESRIRIDHISGEANSKDKIERVRINDESNDQVERDVYGNVISVK